MNSKEQEVFEIFWDHVRRAEMVVREYPYPPTPANWGDPLDEKDEEFLRAYKKIKSHLLKFRRKRLFFPPAGLMLRSGAYHAETAHEALMYFLIKPTEYETAAVLSSPEYLVIKEEAQAELKSRQESVERSDSISEKAKGKRAAIERDLKTLLDVVVGHILAEKQNEHPKPLTWKELRDRLPKDPKPWLQPRISRTLAFLLDAKASRGMDAYKKLYRSKEAFAGFILKYEDRTTSVDATIEDPDPDD